MLLVQMEASTGREATDIEETLDASTDALASDRDASGTPVHRGWAPLGGRHRWMEPFVLAVLATGHGHGYGITGELEAIGMAQQSPVPRYLRHPRS